MGFMRAQFAQSLMILIGLLSVAMPSQSRAEADHSDACQMETSWPSESWVDSTVPGRAAAVAPVAAEGPEVPFPLDAQLPFPWGTIEGTWGASGSGFTAVFSLEVQADPSGRKVLRVLHLHPITGELVAEGVGVALDERRIVRAVMRGQQGAYMLYIGAFKNPKATRPKTVTVFTIRSFASEKERDLQVVVKRISSVVRQPEAPARTR